MQQFELILNSEMLFAREVALAVVVTRPLKSWCYLIPGMFLIDFLRRQKAVRQFSQEYMYPRRHALYCAKASLDGLRREQLESQNAAHAARWQKSDCRNAKEAKALQLKVIELLIPHYQKLLVADGSSYNQLLGSAYPDKSKLQRFWDRLNRLEKDRDHALPEEKMSGRGNSHLETIHNQVALRCRRLIDEAY